MEPGKKLVILNLKKNIPNFKKTCINAFLISFHLSIYPGPSSVNMEEDILSNLTFGAEPDQADTRPQDAVDVHNSDR